MPFPRFWTTSAARSTRADRRRSGIRRPAPDDTPRLTPEEARQRRHRLGGWAVGGALILVIVGVLAAGYYQEFYKPPRLWAGRINDVEFTMGDLVERIRVEQAIAGEVDLGRRPFDYMRNLLHAELLRQEAESMGIEVTDDLVELAIRDRFYPDAPAGQDTAPGQLDQEYRQDLQAYLTRTELSENDLRIIVAEDLRRFLLSVRLSEDIEDPQEQVEVEWIRLDPAGTVNIAEVLDRVANEEFSSVAQDVGVPAGYADADGYVGWLPRRAFPEIDREVFGDAATGRPPLEIGEVRSPIRTLDDIYIVRKLADPEVQPLSGKMRAKVIQQAAEDWQDQRLTQGFEQGWARIRFASKYYNWVSEQVLLSKPRANPGQR